MELAGLRQGILSHRGIKHEEHFVWSSWECLLEDALHLSKLVHEIRLRMEPPRSIDQKYINLPGLRRSKPVERDRRRVGPVAVADHLDTDPIGPDLQLIDRRSAKGIGRHEQGHFATLHQTLGYFRERRGFPDSVHPHGKNYKRLRPFSNQVLQRGGRQRCEDLHQRLPKQALQTTWFRRISPLHLFLEPLHDALDDTRAEICPDQRRFEFLQRCRIWRPPEQPIERPSNSVSRLRQALAEPMIPSHSRDSSLLRRGP